MNRQENPFTRNDFYLLVFVIIAVLTLAFSSRAQTIESFDAEIVAPATLNFSGLQNTEYVQEYYNGGANNGISFVNNRNGFLSGIVETAFTTPPEMPRFPISTASESNTPPPTRLSAELTRRRATSFPATSVTALPSTQTFAARTARKFRATMSASRLTARRRCPTLPTAFSDNLPTAQSARTLRAARAATSSPII